ncbi:MAG: energy transducer TonB [Candidatus Binataceae bacterium]
MVRGRTALDEAQNKFHRFAASESPRPRRHLAAIAVSAAAHLALFAVVLHFVQSPLPAPDDLVVAYLAGTGGNAGSGGGSAAPATAKPRALEHRSHPMKHARREHQRNRTYRSYRTYASHSADPPTDRRVARGGGSTHASRATASAGAGMGGGASIAQAAYGQNPLPPYPASARRREEEGTVTLRVLVGADGAAERVEIAQSSGFDALDEAAAETVRSRWRFIPARRAGRAAESWVLVPIRFALTEASDAD